MLIYWFQFYPIVCQSLGELSKRYPQERNNTVQKAQVVSINPTGDKPALKARTMRAFLFSRFALASDKRIMI